MALRRPCLIVLLLLVLSGCGFQLRDEIVLPEALQVIRVESVDPYSPVGRDLEVALRRAGARTDVGESAQDAAVLRLTRLRETRTPLTVGSSGRAQEYEVTLSAEFELIDAVGEVVVPRQVVELSRDYTFNTAQAQGSSGEEEVVRAELGRDLIASILRRIDAALR